MRIIPAVIVGAALLVAVPARAAEISMKLDDAAQNAVSQLPTLLDQCVAGITMRGDAAVCRGVSNFLLALGNEVRQAQTAANSATDEAAKKAAADKPLADKPAKAATPAK